MVGVLSLPFHIMFAVTGALLCLMFVLMAALGPLAFEGRAHGRVGGGDGYRAGGGARRRGAAAGDPWRAGARA